MSEQYIYLKMIKPWGGFNIGDIVRFGLNKGLDRIDKGEGIKVPKQSAINDPAPLPVKTIQAKTAIAPTPKEIETAEVTPILTNTITPEKTEETEIKTGRKKGRK